MMVVLSLRVDFTCNLHNFTCIFLSVTVQGIRSKVRDVDSKVIPVNLRHSPIEDFSKTRLIETIMN